MRNGAVAVLVVLTVMVSYLLLWLIQKWMNTLTQYGYDVVSSLFR